MWVNYKVNWHIKNRWQTGSKQAENRKEGKLDLQVIQTQFKFLKYLNISKLGMKHYAMKAVIFYRPQLATSYAKMLIQ